MASSPSGAVREVGIQEAKTHLSRLVERVAAGEQVTITRRGEAVAVLSPPPRDGRRQLGWAPGAVVVHDGFDDPLPDEDVLFGGPIEP